MTRAFSFSCHSHEYASGCFINNRDQLRTEAGSDGVHVGVVPLAVDGVRRAVAVGQEDGGVVGDVLAPDEGDGAEDPAHLRHAPRKGEHAGADNCGDGVCSRCPYRSCKYSTSSLALVFTVLTPSTAS
jgi:hypothetical protein